MSIYLFKVAFSGVYANMRMVHVLTSVVVSPIAVISKVIKMLVCAVVIIFCFLFYFINFFSFFTKIKPIQSY